MSQCKLRVGARVVLGPGQSASCDKELYPASAVNQLYIPNDSQKDILYIEQCSSGVAWP
jgi:hypothetical protein